MNVSLDNRLWQLGAFILVECKKRNTHVDIHQIRNIAHISNMKGNKTSILFATNGITSDAQAEIHRLAAENLYILCITTEELRDIKSEDECEQLVIDKWEFLRETIDVTAIL